MYRILIRLGYWPDGKLENVTVKTPVIWINHDWTQEEIPSKKQISELLNKEEITEHLMFTKWPKEVNKWQTNLPCDYFGYIGIFKK